MYCEQFLVRIDAYLNEDMDDAERAAFRSHLGTCRECREVAEISDPTLLFASIPQREPNSAQVDACVSAVTALIHQDRLTRRMRTGVRGWMMAAAAVLFLVIGIGTMSLRSPAVIDAGTEVAVAAEAATPDVKPPQVEVDMVGEGVRVYQFAHEEDANTAVYFIVNSAMEL